LNSLEIYTNQTDHSEKGSLFWTLDRTKTRFGRRLLRNWVGRPLLDKVQLERRIEAVEELTKTERSRHVDRLKHVLSSIKSDLEKILIRIYYKRAARPELLGFLQTMQRISGEYSHVKTPADAGFKSTLINEACAVLPVVGDQVVEFLNRIRLQPAKDDDKYAFFRGDFESEAISDYKLSIGAVEHELSEHRADAAKKLGRRVVEYATVAGIEYLIEVENTKTALSKVPASWVKISSTKKQSRFHSPEVIKLLRERDQNKESLAAACDEAFKAFLAEISEHYQALRDTIQSLALLDCLISLADVATQPGYSMPTFTSENHIVVSQGRHPMVEQLLLDSYVPNDITLASKDDTAASTLLITGPNMGGKSSYVRSVALIAIMGQIGSFVPAASAELPMLDAVFTRMGAFDNMMRGESTFMVELSETSDILKQATSRSLVILDELGRGTSTHDGVAIAEAVVRELVDRHVMTMFITHYQDLSRLQGSCPGLKNVHMRFTESGKKEEEEITFLYEVGEGVAHRSYGYVDVANSTSYSD
jgi:DNA mismatch repair protein MSH3